MTAGAWVLKYSITCLRVLPERFANLQACPFVLSMACRKPSPMGRKVIHSSPKPLRGAL